MTPCHGFGGEVIGFSGPMSPFRRGEQGLPCCMMPFQAPTLARAMFITQLRVRKDIAE
jgi:hypothetical protein